MARSHFDFEARRRHSDLIYASLLRSLNTCLITVGCRDAILILSMRVYLTASTLLRAPLRSYVCMWS
jgi:hypothetical protein